MFSGSWCSCPHTIFLVLCLATRCLLVCNYCSFQNTRPSLRCCGPNSLNLVPAVIVNRWSPSTGRSLLQLFSICDRFSVPMKGLYALFTTEMWLLSCFLIISRSLGLECRASLRCWQANIPFSVLLCSAVASTLRVGPQQNHSVAATHRLIRSLQIHGRGYKDMRPDD